MASTSGQPTGDVAQPAIDYKAQYEQLHRSNSELGRRIAERDKAYADVQRQVADFNKRDQENRKQAEVAKLKPYMARHPDYQNTQMRVQKADAFLAAMEAAPPELQNNPQYKASLAARLGVKNEDLALRDEANAHKAQVTQQMASDPEAFIAQRAEQIAEQKFQEMFSRKQQEFQIEQEIHQDFNDPIVRQFASEHNDEVRQAIEDGVPPKYAAHQIKLFHALTSAESKIAELEARLEGQSQEVGMAKEQQRLLKSRATITREPASKAVSDPHKSWQSWCQENKVTNILSPGAQRKLQEFIKASMQSA